MARASPDPVVIEVVEPDPRGGTYVIAAYRDGGYTVTFGGNVLFHGSSPLLPGSRIPADDSLRDEAIAMAKIRIGQYRTGP